MQLAAALRGLVLEAAEGHELTFGIEHTLHRRRAEGSDQLILQVGIARIEAVVLGALARGHAGTLEAAPHVPQLGDVAQPGQPQAQALRTQRLHEALHVRGTERRARRRCRSFHVRIMPMPRGQYATRRDTAQGHLLNHSGHGFARVAAVVRVRLAAPHPERRFLARLPATVSDSFRGIQLVSLAPCIARGLS